MSIPDASKEKQLQIHDLAAYKKATESWRQNKNKNKFEGELLNDEYSSKFANKKGKGVVRKVLFRMFLLLMVVLISMAIQHKYNIAYKIVYYENIYFHSEEFDIGMKLSALDDRIPSGIYKLNIGGKIKFSIAPEYQLKAFIPNEFIVLNPEGVQNKTMLDDGYTVYDFNITKRKYRDMIVDLPILVYAAEGDVSGKLVKILVSRGNENIYEKDYSLL